MLIRRDFHALYRIFFPSPCRIWIVLCFLCHQLCVICVSRVRAPQWGSSVQSTRNAHLIRCVRVYVCSLHTRALGCVCEVNRVCVDMHSLSSFSKWSVWIVHHLAMLLVPILWLASQARAAPSLTTEQMDMGVVRAFIYLYIYLFISYF